MMVEPALMELLWSHGGCMLVESVSSIVVLGLIPSIHPPRFPFEVPGVTGAYPSWCWVKVEYTLDGSLVHCKATLRLITSQTHIHF